MNQDRMSRRSPYLDSLRSNYHFSLQDALITHNYISAVQLIECDASLGGFDDDQLLRLLCASCWMNSLAAVVNILRHAPPINQAIHFNTQESALRQSKHDGWVALVDYVRSMPRYLPVDESGKIHTHHWISADYEDLTPLNFAALFAQADVVQALVCAGADVSSNRYVSLMFAAEANKPDVLTVLLTADPHAREHAKSAIIQASAMGHIECLRVLLEAGAAPSNPEDKLGGVDPETVDLSDRCTTSPLFQAIRANQVESVRLLCRYGADPRDDYVLHWGSMSGGNAFDMLREAEFFDGSPRDLRIFHELYNAPALNRDELVVADWTIKFLFEKAIREEQPDIQHILMQIRSDDGEIETYSIVETAVEKGDVQALRIFVFEYRYPLSEPIKKWFICKVFVEALTRQRYQFLPVVCAAYSNYSDYLLQAGEYVIPGVYSPLTFWASLGTFLGILSKPRSLLAKLCQAGDWPSVAVLWVLGNDVIRNRIERTLESHSGTIPEYSQLMTALDVETTFENQIAALQTLYPTLSEALGSLLSIPAGVLQPVPLEGVNVDSSQAGSSAANESAVLLANNATAEGDAPV